MAKNEKEIARTESISRNLNTKMKKMKKRFRPTKEETN